MVIGASEAFIKTFGLIIVYIAIQIRGERRQNQEYLASHRPPES